MSPFSMDWLSICFEDLENKKLFPSAKEVSSCAVMFLSCLFLNLCFLRLEHHYVQSSYSKSVMEEENSCLKSYPNVQKEETEVVCTKGKGTLGFFQMEGTVKLKLRHWCFSKMSQVQQTRCQNLFT